MSLSTDIFEVDEYRQCNLTSSSHFVLEEKICNGIYDCLDRSDEVSCTDERRGNTAEDKLLIPPKLSTFEQCSAGNETGVRVGQECRLYYHNLHATAFVDYKK